MTPLPPNGISVFASTVGLCLRINWSVVTGVDSYNLYRSEIPYDQFSLIARLSGPAGITYFDKPPRPNDNFDFRFYYQVSSVSGLTESTWSGPTTYLSYGAFDTKPLPGACWTSLF